VEKLAGILIKMADDPEVKEIMRKAGSDTAKTTPEEFRAQIQREITQWTPLIKEIAAQK
jgi:tripartite-type tricarboxylate transporter receptor subunit TctC